MVINIPLGFIGMVLIILKLAGVITWSWWLVTLPIWLPLVFIFSIWFLLLLITIIVEMNK